MNFTFDDGTILEVDNLIVEDNSYPQLEGKNVVKATFSCVDIPNRVLFNCQTLRSIIFEKDVLTIGRYSFANCANLNQVLIFPQKLTKIGDNAFQNCSSIYGDIIIPQTCVHIGVKAFQNCFGLDGLLYFPRGSLAYYSSDLEKQFGFHFHKTNLTLLRLESDITPEERIGHSLLEFFNERIKI